MYNGIINIYKEKGYTSHDVVAKMRGILQQRKIGHTGTLDPDAEGVLPVCLGSGTKLCDMLTDRDKEYEACLRLGVVTDTQDLTGAVLQSREVDISEEELRRVITGFVGEYDQIPPMYSALKVNGKKLCDLAREGREVERKPRRVTFYEIQVLQIAMPFVYLKVVCSKGTYIRTLCHDIGEQAGCGGAMADLKRTRSGCFTSDTAITLEELVRLRDAGRLEEVLIPVDSMFPELPAVHVQPDFDRLLQNGNSLPPQCTLERRRYKDGEEVCVYDAAGTFYGVYCFREESRQFKPVKMFFPV